MKQEEYNTFCLSASAMAKKHFNSLNAETYTCNYFQLRRKLIKRQRIEYKNNYCSYIFRICSPRLYCFTGNNA